MSSRFFLSIVLFSPFVLFRFVSFLLIFHFSETPKKNFFVALTVDQKPKLKLKLKPPTIGTKIFFCVRNRKTNEEKEAAKEERRVRVSACTHACVCECVRVWVKEREAERHKC